jgi:hypothetical protein
MKLELVAGLSTLLLVTGCGGSIKVVRTGPRMDAKPADCLVEFLEDPPTRQYVELAEMTSKVLEVSSAGPMLLRGATRVQAAESVLHQKACELGADAVIVIRAQVINDVGHMLVAGMAIRYLPPPAEQSSPESESEAPPPSP